jgi:hypothetical protein
LTKSGLEISQHQLTQTQTSLDTKAAQLADVSQRLDATKTELAQTKTDYSHTAASLNTEKELTAQLQTNIDNLAANLQLMTTGYGYVANDVTYAQAKAFIAADNTDNNLYIDEMYVCEDFAFDVVTHALQQKIRCAFVSIRYPVSAHAIIAFNTTDRGVIYFEPQSDEEVRLQIGKHYWTQCVIATGGGYLFPDYDDTIQRFNVIW